jgi:hypothetical protein
MRLKARSATVLNRFGDSWPKALLDGRGFDPGILISQELPSRERERAKAFLKPKQPFRGGVAPTGASGATIAEPESSRISIITIEKCSMAMEVFL